MSLRWRVVVTAALLGALGSLTRTARAAEITLDWDAPPGCPTQATALSAVTRLAGEGTPRELSASVRIRQVGARWVAEVTAAGGARELHGTTCLEVAQSAAVILAL